MNNTENNVAAQAGDEPMRALPHLPRAVGYLHTMDNTEGLKGNQPWRIFNFIKRNPFGKAGLDYSASYPVTNEALFTASQMKEYARAALADMPSATANVERDAKRQDERVERLVRAAKVYTFNYLQDEHEEPELCTCGPKQHAELVELFAALAAIATTKPGA